MDSPIWHGSAPVGLLTELWSRRSGPWRHFDPRGSALHEWHPPPPTRPTQRSTISITTRTGAATDLISTIWDYYRQAAGHYAVELAPILEPEAISRTRTGCRLDTHRDYQAATLSMSIALIPPSRYQGGVFHIDTPDGTVELKPQQGTVLVFPSQWRHGVTRVTHGTRHTYVSKALGAPNPEVTTVNPHTGRVTTAQPPDPSELARRRRVQQTHNRMAATAHANNDLAGAQAAIAWLWSHR